MDQARWSRGRSVPAAAAGCSRSWPPKSSSSSRGPGSGRSGDIGSADERLRGAYLREVILVVVERDTEKRRDIEPAERIGAALVPPAVGTQRVEAGDGPGPRGGEDSKGTLEGVVTRPR